MTRFIQGRHLKIDITVTNIHLTLLNPFFNNSYENEEGGHPDLNVVLNEEDDLTLIKRAISFRKSAIFQQYKLPKFYSSDDEESDLEVCFIIISLRKLYKYFKIYRFNLFSS